MMNTDNKRPVSYQCLGSSIKVMASLRAGSLKEHDQTTATWFICTLFIINLHTKYIGFYSGNGMCHLNITIHISLRYVFGLERSETRGHMMTRMTDIGLLYMVEQLYLIVIQIYDYICIFSYI